LPFIIEAETTSKTDSGKRNAVADGNRSLNIVTEVDGEETLPSPSKYYQKYNVGEDQNWVVKLASKISNNDLDWITTLERENGLWDMYRLHPNQNRDGSWDYSCGLNSYYHWPMIEKIIARTVSEKEILEYCYEVYNKRHGAFYGYYKRHLATHLFYLTN